MQVWRRFGYAAAAWALFAVVRPAEATDQATALNGGHFDRVEALERNLLAQKGFFAALDARSRGGDWKAGHDPDLIEAVQGYMRDLGRASDGVVSQIIVLDRFGQVFAAWPGASKTDQSDMERVKQTIAVGDKARYIGPVRKATSAGAWIIDETRNAPCDYTPCWVRRSYDIWRQDFAKTIAVNGRGVGVLAIDIDIMQVSKRR